MSPGFAQKSLDAKDVLRQKFKFARSLGGNSSEIHVAHSRNYIFSISNKMQAVKSGQLDALASNLLDISPFMKCPICKEYLKNPVELRCNHMFCVSCIDRHSKGSKYSCPVCSTIVTKRSARPAREIGGALKFVKSITTQLREATSHSIPESKLSSKKAPPENSPDKIYPLKRQKTKGKVPIMTTVKTIPKTAPETTTKMKPPEIKAKKKINKVVEKPQVASKQTETRPNQKLVVQISKQDQIVEPYKENVLKWLCNSQNLFDRNTQTQQGQKVLKDSYSKGMKIPKNLKSVSQRVVQRRTLPPREAAGDRNYQRNCRSLESLPDTSPLAETTSTKSKPRKCNVNPSIFDTPVDETELEESRIEEIDSSPFMSKSAICKRIEEKCLEAIDENRKKIGRKRKKIQDENQDEAADKSMRSDWLRINKLSNKLDRIDGIPKKLKICANTTVDKENKTAKTNVNNEAVVSNGTQFSTTMTSQSGRVLDENKASGSGIKAKLAQNIQKVSLDKSKKEIEVSKRAQSTSSSIIIDFNEKYKCNVKKDIGNPNHTNNKTKDNKIKQSPTKHNDNDDDMFLQATQPITPIVLEEIIEETPSPMDDDVFLAATQRSQTPPSATTNKALESKCEDFFTQFNDLSARLSSFLTANTTNNEISEIYSKLSLVQKHLKNLQPKFSSMSLILGRNETDTILHDVVAEQSTQTEDHVNTIEVYVQTSQARPFCKMIQTSPTSPIAKKLMIEHGVQTSPKFSGSKKLPVVHEMHEVHNKQEVYEDSVMKNTLDFLDFDTQAAIKRAERSKLETFTNMHTEQMQLTAFIRQMEMEPSDGECLEVCKNNADVFMGIENKHEHGDSGLLPVRQPNTQMDKTLVQSTERKARRKLYRSPGIKTPSPLSSDVGVGNKRVKPLIISDSEEDEPAPVFNKFIRDDISVCFDSESQKGNENENEMNSPNDQYLDDVWHRIKDHLDASKKSEAEIAPEPKVKPKPVKHALQTAIKTNTQDLIAKCEQLISNPAKRPNSQIPQLKQVKRTQHKTQEDKQIGVTDEYNLKRGTSSADLLTDSIFGDNDDDLFENFATPSPCTSSRDKPKSTLHNLHSDLIYKDSNSSIMTNILDENPLQVTAIKIIQDIQITSRKDINKEKEQEIPVVKHDSDDDLIFSTPETTPTKIKLLDIIPPELVLPPPPDFQDGGSGGPSTSQHRNKLLNASQNTINLSPIQASSSRSRNVYNTPMTSATAVNREKTASKRVTSTPYCKITPSPLPFKPNLNNSLSCTPKPNLNQPPITNFLRKGETQLGQAPQLMDDDDLFIKKSQAVAVVACTRLDKIQMIAINALGKRGLARYSSGFDSSVTHMIVATNDGNCAKDHTIKYVRAVAAGIWVVNCKWVEDSLIHKKLLPEEYYEVYDVSGQSGPRHSRLYRSSRPLFDRFKLFVAPPFELIMPKEVEDIITSLGGLTVPSAEKLLPKEDYVCLIVTETGQTQDEQYVKYQDWADKLRVATVDFEWLTRSIGAYKLYSLRRFALCTDESLCELGYPEHLLENVPCSFTQNE